MPNGHPHTVKFFNEFVEIAKTRNRLPHWQQDGSTYFVTYRLNESLGKKGALWQKDYFDRIIRSWEHMVRVARYVRRNPLKAKLREGEYFLYEAEWVRNMLG